MVAPDGLLVVDKPSGWTSHDVVGRCRRLAATRKVGHAGTLDPMATGVLVLGIGRATRLLGHLALSDKAYDATIRLGQATLSDDADGPLVASTAAGNLSDSDIEDAVAQLRGDLQQVPSSVSAIKIQGERAYARVRAGDDVVLTARRINVAVFEVDAIRRGADLVDVDVRVECSTGTYVRALARDIGNRLHVGGHLTALRRTRVGAYPLSQAHTLDELAGLESAELPVIALDRAARSSFPEHVVHVQEVAAVRNGRPLALDLSGAVYATAADGTAGSAGATRTGTREPVAMFAPDGRFLALYEQRGIHAVALTVFAPASAPS